MTATFSTTRLVDGRVLVKGTDVLGTEGVTTVDATQWDEVKRHSQFNEASEAFEAAVEEFFKPLTKAAEAMNTKLDVPRDPASFVVLEEEVEATAGKPGVVVSLSKDSVILRLIEAYAFDRLVWVDGVLEVMAVEAPVTEDEAVANVEEILGGEEITAEPVSENLEG